MKTKSGRPESEKRSHDDERVRRYRLSPKDQVAMINEFMTLFWPYIRYKAYKYSGTPLTVSYDAFCNGARVTPLQCRMIQAARCGIIEAVRRYQLGSGHPFRSYLRLLVRVEMVHELADHVGIPRTSQRHYREVMCLYRALLKEKGYPPSISEVAAQTKIRIHHVRAILRRILPLAEDVDQSSTEDVVRACGVVLADPNATADISQAYDEVIETRVSLDDKRRVFAIGTLLYADENKWESLDETIKSGMRDDWPGLRREFRLERLLPAEWPDVLVLLTPWLTGSNPVKKLREKFYYYRKRIAAELSCARR